MTGIPGATRGRGTLSFQPAAEKLTPRLQGGAAALEGGGGPGKRPAKSEARGFSSWPTGHQPHQAAPAAPRFLKLADPAGHRAGMNCSIPLLLEARGALEHRSKKENHGSLVGASSGLVLGMVPPSSTHTHHAGSSSPHGHARASRLGHG